MAKIRIPDHLQYWHLDYICRCLFCDLDLFLNIPIAPGTFAPSVVVAAISGGYMPNSAFSGIFHTSTRSFSVHPYSMMPYLSLTFLTALQHLHQPSGCKSGAVIAISRAWRPKSTFKKFQMLILGFSVHISILHVLPIFYIPHGHTNTHTEEKFTRHHSNLRCI
ncbi:hypothetical protein B0H10DRAFT_2109031 [Mycena sp. CBHHK59/15]|nr:hypothetical protein B0H10DRAFT_2109031 [Mycena sp. CBHHK59/15]